MDVQIFLLIALIQKQESLELLDEEVPSLEVNNTGIQNHDPARWLNRNRRTLKNYEALVRTAITLDALLSAEGDISLCKP